MMIPAPQICSAALLSTPVCSFAVGPNVPLLLIWPAPALHRSHQTPFSMLSMHLTMPLPHAPMHNL